MAVPSTLYVVGVLLALVVSLVAVRRMDGGAWGAELRTRFVLGVPWGTVLTVLFVLAVYLFVQGGWSRWYDPVVTPFRAWSSLYPFGVLTAPFSHDGAGHLTGNLIGTLISAPVAEYAWSHYPRERGSSTFSSLRTNPYVRILVVPAVAIVVGVLTGLFSWGPVIGFSGVVFAFAAFAVVTRPITAIVAILGVGNVLSLLNLTYRNPVLEVTAQPRPPSPPWWAGIAVQGHAVGVVVGVLLAALFLRAREEYPRAFRIFLAVLLFAVVKNLWAVYWFRGNEKYVLFRWAGALLVVGLALVVTVSVAARDRPILSSEWVTPRRLGSIVLVLALAVMAGIAVPVNLVAVDETATPPAERSVEIRGYSVTYAENVQNRMVSVINVSGFGESTAVKTSGVIVVNPDREIWVQGVSKGRLAFLGRDSVAVGGLGWRERVVAIREGWKPVNSPATYHVWLRPPDGERKHVFNASPSTAEPVIDNRTVTVVARPETEDFRLTVRLNRTDLNGSTVLGHSRIPPKGENATTAGIRFVRDGDLLFAVADGTRVRVAKKEAYRTLDTD